MGDYQVSINTSSTVILPVGNDSGPYYLTNVGSIPVYVSDSFQVSPTDGTVLNVGASMEWRKGAGLFAVCTGSGTLSLSTTANNVFDPAAIAARINAIGVPAVDMPVILYTSSVVVNDSVTPAASSLITVSTYQTLYIRVSEVGVPATNVIRSYYLIWYADSGGLVEISREAFKMAVYGGTAELQRAVKGAYFRIAGNAAATGVPATINTTVVGSLRSTFQPRTWLESSGNNLTGNLVTDDYHMRSGLTIWYLPALGAGSSSTEYPNGYVGCWATVEWRTTSTVVNTLAGDIQTWDGLTYVSQQVASSSSHQTTMWLPAEPLSLFAINFDPGPLDLLMAIVAQPT